MTEPAGWVPPQGPPATPPGAGAGAGPLPRQGPPPAPADADGRGRGIVPLRPLRLGEIYDGAFRAVRTNPRTMLGASAVVAVVLALVQLLPAGLGLDTSLEELSTSAAPTAGEFAAVFASTVPGLLVSVVAGAVLSGALGLAVADAVLGRRPTAGQLWLRVRPRLLALVALSLVTVALTALAVVACLAPGGVLLAVGVLQDSDGLVGAGVVLLLAGGLGALAAGIWVSTRLFMAAPALVVERVGVGEALRRGWRLTSARLWPVLGTHLLALLAVGLIAGVVSAPFQLAGSLLPLAVDPDDATLLLLSSLGPLAVGQALASTVTYPLAAAVAVLQYLDARMRLEGLDPSRTPVTAG